MAIPDLLPANSGAEAELSPGRPIGFDGRDVTELNDIASSEDIRTLVDSFYAKALNDPVIGFLFTEVAQIDLPTHLPKLYNFWEMVLLGGQTYQGSPLMPHFHLHMRHPLERAHFVRWLELFHQTVDEGFTGPVADLAKARAERIAQNFHARIEEGQEAGLFVSKGYPRKPVADPAGGGGSTRP